jgi:D-glycero-D-manno-heptose 1,7-bisphosphate phosphatase
MQDQLALRGAFIDAFYYCMHHLEARIEKYRGYHVNRKPGPGMIPQAFSDLTIERPNQPASASASRRAT